MNSTLDPSTFWQRLQHNGEANTAMFVAAGLRPELVAEVGCPACGLRENAVFWSCRERTDHFLHLRCPRCERGSVWYSLKKNAAIESFARLSRVLCGSAALLLTVAAGSLATIHADLLPPRLETRVVAASQTVIVGRQHLEAKAGIAARWTGAVASAGYQRALLLKDPDNRAALSGKPVLGPRARRWWTALVTLGQE
jgi:hypothetical protein